MFRGCGIDLKMHQLFKVIVQNGVSMKFLKSEGVVYVWMPISNKKNKCTRDCARVNINYKLRYFSVPIEAKQRF